MKASSKVTCNVCGDDKAGVYLRPFGREPDGRPVAWICTDCDNRVPATMQRTPARESVHGKPALKWSTIAKAEQLARAGQGWTADQVMRRALSLLEERYSINTHLGGKPS